MDNHPWPKALLVTLTFDRSSERARAQEKAPSIVLKKSKLHLDTEKLENQRTRQPSKAGHPENPVAPGGV